MMVILEEIRSQNRATLEQGLTTRQVLEQRIDEVERRGEERSLVLEAAIRSVAADVAGIKVDLTRVEAKVDRLVPLEERVLALERDR